MKFALALWKGTTGCPINVTLGASAQPTTQKCFCASGILEIILKKHIFIYIFCSGSNRGCRRMGEELAGLGEIKRWGGFFGDSLRFRQSLRVMR